MAALLALQGVSKAFGSLRVIDELTLEVFDREALGVIGPNGAGKTTALNLLIGRLRPERGAVVFAGRDITDVPPHARCRAGIALTHQIPHPFDASPCSRTCWWAACSAAGGPSARPTVPRWPRSS